MKHPLVFAVALLALGVFPAPAEETQSSPLKYGYEVVATYTHDTGAFTQGLEFEKGRLFEGTGQHGESALREVELATGKVLREHKLAREHFGEGITILGERVYQLTWQSRKGFIYNLADFAPQGEFSYRTEGWGLTNDGKSLIMSDGSAWLYFLDPTTFQVTRQVEVLDRGRPVKQLNELEWMSGMLLANVWQTNEIVVIDPGTGKVLARADLSGLLPAAERQPKTDVLNGIAWDEEAQKLYVTGKYWPKLFEIKLTLGK
jgi:glutamine cyclotransferase